MTTEEKSYIEQNIELIENGNWEQLFKNIPDSFIDNDLCLGDLLYDADIHFLNDCAVIPANAFSSSKKVRSLEFIPSNVHTIGESSFACCNMLRNLTIPTSIVNILADAFYSCENLKQLRIPGTVEYIGESAFQECSELTTVNIEHGVKTIGQGAFCACENLQMIYIPVSVTSIELSAFELCGKFQIRYSGTVEQWERLTNNVDSFSESEYICRCLDGTLTNS